MTSLGSRGVTEDVNLPKEFTPVTSHSIAFVDAYFAPMAAGLNRVNTCILTQVDPKGAAVTARRLRPEGRKESRLVT